MAPREKLMMDDMDWMDENEKAGSSYGKEF